MSTNPNTESELAMVLFLDMVGYSLLPIEKQEQAALRFRQVLSRYMSEQSERALAIDTGDGAAVALFGNPSTTIRMAHDLGVRIKDAGIDARMGLHCGPLIRTQDLNGNPTVQGPAINMAERVMAFADSGQFLLSGTAAEIVSAFGEWATWLEDLGEHEIKHGGRIRLVNLVTESIGQSGVPERLRAALSSVQNHRTHNLPEPDRPFIGRRNERESLRSLIEERAMRCITITGSGGIGKSRLALAVAFEVRDDFADRVWFVECDSFATGEDVVARIAQLLEIPLHRDPVQDLTNALADRQCLFVLDCFERIAAYGRVIEEILKGAPEIQIIVTSRVLLGIPRESEFPLGPLSMKREGRASADAVELFVASAKAALPGFRITRQNREWIQEIVQAVEAIPLAIILAAGRLRHLSLQELKQQVRQRQLKVLKRRVGDDRHANLSRVIEDSFTLLSPDLQELLISLSVFRGGFTLPDAQEVLSQSIDILEGASELRDNSLLSAQPVQGQMRYRALDVVAEYVENCADAQSLEPLRLRHAELYAHHARILRNLYDAGRWRDANAGLAVELGNYRRAIEYAIEQRSAPHISSFGKSLARLFMEAGFRADFERLAMAALKHAEETNDPTLLIEIEGLMGGVARRDGEFKKAEAYWTKRAESCAQASEPEMEADAWLDLASLALLQKDLSSAEKYLARFERLEQQLPNGLVLASGYVTRAKVEVERERPARAKTLADRALSLIDRLPQGTHSFYVWGALADIYNSIGRAEAAVELCRKGISEAIAGTHYPFAGELLCKLAISLEQQGKPELASRALAIAESIPKSVSRTLREEVRQHKEEFVRKHGTIVLNTALQAQDGLTWSSAAVELIDRLSTPVD